MKFLTKKLGYLAAGSILIGSITAAVVYKKMHKFKPTFYNYGSYMAQDSKNILSSIFDYKEFDTIHEFTKAILTNKALSGIGNDSQAAQLIKRDKLERIDYDYLFDLRSKLSRSEQIKLDNTTKLSDEWFSILEPEIKKLFTDLGWNHMKQYDSLLTEDYLGHKFNDGKTRKLYQYFVPYFAQDMVIVYNPTKLGKEYTDESKIVELETNLLNKINKNYKMDNILKILSNTGFSKWEATNAVRDNMIYGSSYRYNSKTNIYEEQPTGEAWQVNRPHLYQDLIDSFIDLIDENIGKKGEKIIKTDNIKFLGDGQELLNNIINPYSSIQAGIMYNGDAIDAYFSEDNFKDVKQGTIRFIRPKINLLLIDGFVIVKGTNSNLYKQTLEVAKKSFLNGLNISEWKSENAEQYHSYINYDFVGYTPVFKNQFNYINNNYFEDISDPYEKEYIKSLFSIKSKMKINEINTVNTWLEYDINHIAIQPVNQKTQTEINKYWNFKIKK
ncbi:type 2 periplasmic-binding domain-containing protein [Mycoplasmopsis lipofaciens]|uniref:hypothetical protein n=1 Tax=Mycoplasmopsis lipofaciens TaxID=114884 RepID=UPI0004805733|nr:hypothetical protein [Mycoplasmopsis lipofaciens]